MCFPIQKEQDATLPWNDGIKLGLSRLGLLASRIESNAIEQSLSLMCGLSLPVHSTSQRLIIEPKPGAPQTRSAFCVVSILYSLPKLLRIKHHGHISVLRLTLINSEDTFLSKSPLPCHTCIQSFHLLALCFSGGQLCTPSWVSSGHTWQAKTSSFQGSA